MHENQMPDSTYSTSMVTKGNKYQMRIPVPETTIPVHNNLKNVFLLGKLFFRLNPCIDFKF